MPSWRFWEKQDETEPDRPGARRRTATIGGPVPRPRPESRPAAPAGDREQRLARLRKRRELVLFDVEQAELAQQPENPWQERIDLLHEAIGTVESDLKRLEQQPKLESAPVPPTPIAEVAVSIAEPPSVSFRIGGEDFRYEEEIDWAERGTTVVYGELTRRAGDAAKLVPTDTPNRLANALREHLSASLFVFATDLRERKLASAALPDAPTLADLARPCPECGGWRDWKGHCRECQQRMFARQQLEAEAVRLEREQAHEDEDRAKWAERLPVARRRLADVDAEIASVGG